MRSQPPPLASAEELCAIARRALELLEFCTINPPSQASDAAAGEERARDHDLRRSAMEALRFCAAATTITRAPALVPYLAAVMDELDGSPYHLDDLSVMTEGLEKALRAGARADTVEGLVEHAEPKVRRALAAGLRPAGREEREILEELAGDGDPGVRAAARETLGDVPWWVGKWSRDPLALLTHQEAEQHRAALEEISALCDQRRWKIDGDDEALARLAATLPDAVAVDFAETALSARSAEATERPLLGAMMLGKAGGVSAFLRLVDRWRDLPRFSVREGHVRMIEAQPSEVRFSLCMTLARQVAEAARGTKEERERGERLVSLATKAFPLDADPAPLLELILTIPRPEVHGYDRLGRYLADALHRPPSLPDPVLRRILDAFVAGSRGPWCHLESVAERRAELLPEAELRAYAERAAVSTDEGTARWGLALLLGRAHDPQRDPPRPTLAARLCEDPRARALLAGRLDTRRLLLPWLRAALRRGEADLHLALAAVEGAADLWGGVLDEVDGGTFDRDPVAVERGRQEARDKLGDLLGPPELQGPVTGEEWAMLRAARSRHAPWTPRDVHCAMGVLPPGPWHPEDRAMLDRTLDTIRGGDRSMARWLAPVLCEKPEVALLPLFAELEALCEGLDDQQSVAHLRRAAHERLGLPVEGDEDEDDEEDDEGEDGEWMDEPDD